ncbi:MAG: hypothetical protein OQK35_06525 [Alphaproteobacteria bacterium]|nr:hypothetical protein [Alphaproteobacteria bacterium]
MPGEKITRSERIRLSEVIFEIRHVGRMVRVIAVDPITAIEVSTIVPFTVGQKNWERLAKRKLEYVITKKLRANEKKKGTGFIV